MHFSYVYVPYANIRKQITVWSSKQKSLQITGCTADPNLCQTNYVIFFVPWFTFLQNKKKELWVKKAHEGKNNVIKKDKSRVRYAHTTFIWCWINKWNNYIHTLASNLMVQLYIFQQSKISNYGTCKELCNFLQYELITYNKYS